jgi:hypothetical protein
MAAAWMRWTRNQLVGGEGDASQGRPIWEGCKRVAGRDFRHRSRSLGLSELDVERRITSYLMNTEHCLDGRAEVPSPILGTQKSMRGV